MVDFDRKIFSWLDKHYRRPFFLYIHYIDPHSPYGAPEPFRHFFDKDYEGDIRGTKKFLRNKQRFRENKADLEHLIALYDDEIRYIDSRFGGLIRKLEQLNILDDSVILFLSDHGEGFLEHGRFFHSYSVYSELVNVPLIMSHRTSFERDYEEKCVQHIDVFPTITHILKIDTDSLVLEGNSVLSKSDEEVTVISEHLREGWGVPQRCVISGNWKLVHNTDSSIYRLFDIEKDPLDRKNLIRENAEVADDLKSYLSGWQKSLSDKKEAPKVKLDSVTKEKLRSLGYLQ